MQSATVLKVWRAASGGDGGCGREGPNGMHDCELAAQGATAMDAAVG